MIRDRLGKQLDLIIDGGACNIEPTTVVSLLDGEPEVQRVGLGDPAPFGGAPDHS
jgi:tRNA A37 threonylcarbamoyladenosine synthetase subunit TsaC/SUA5/YrdC